MATTFSLQVITANRIFYDGRANMIILPGTDGEIGIMPHHENMVVAVTSGVMRIQKPDEEWIEAAVSSGFASVANNRIKLIVYSAERPEEIDIRLWPRRPRSVLRSVFVRSRALRSTICRRHLLQGRWRGLRKPGRCTLRVIEEVLQWC